jgi:hypothetical protein
MKIHHIEPTPIDTDAAWRRVFIDASMASIRATGAPVAADDEVPALLMGQPNAADNGPWLVRADGSRRRPDYIDPQSA